VLFAQASFAQSPSPNMRSASYALDWTATGENSGGSMASSSYRLNATIGQMAANTRSTSASYQLASGFQAAESLGDPYPFKVYLPIVYKNYPPQ
jgi:hypothetical protein